MCVNDRPGDRLFLTELAESSFRETQGAGGGKKKTEDDDTAHQSRRQSYPDSLSMLYGAPDDPSVIEAAKKPFAEVIR